MPIGEDWHFSQWISKYSVGIDVKLRDNRKHVKQIKALRSKKEINFQK